MVTTSLMLLAALSAQPTKTTPAEIITVCYFNDAKVDATLLNHEVDVTSKVTSIVRDGIGGYIAKLDTRLQTTEFDARASVHCHFDGASINALTRVRPGREVTIRGVVRKIVDDMNHYVDPNVQVTMKSCALVGE
jgi:hypothetical protein